MTRGENSLLHQHPWNRSPQKEMSERPIVLPAKAGIQKFLIFPGFRVALAIASLPGMTIKLFNGFGNMIPVSVGSSPARSVSICVRSLTK
jgi:hypothetical protein